jgi:hypothetical protein
LSQGLITKLGCLINHAPKRIMHVRVQATGGDRDVLGGVRVAHGSRGD